MRFVDLFAGLGGFHLALQRQGHECVFASEIDIELRKLYIQNFPYEENRTFGDIRFCKDKVPQHEILCAGFPCQPFSKSGTQLGMKDKEQGTLFDDIVYILDRCRPEYVILENVGNFERHDKGRTWRIVRKKLKALNYDIRGTEHISSGGSGLISPHHLGFPHSRERFFIVARQGKLPQNPFPPTNRNSKTNLESIIQSASELTEQDLLESRLTDTQSLCIEHWNLFLSKFPEEAPLPSFPIWGDEIDATYPYIDYTPYKASLKELKQSLNGHIQSETLSRNELICLLPSYARTEVGKFPVWKVEFIRRNREWFQKYREYFPQEWVEKLWHFPSSYRKLEWNCQGEDRDLWRYVLQFRPSGLRVKRYTSSPSLVAMTSTQIPILGPEKRFLTRVEGLRLQGFPDDHNLPISRDKAFQALGNAVHVDVVEAIVRNFVKQ